MYFSTNSEVKLAKNVRIGAAVVIHLEVPSRKTQLQTSTSVL